MLPVVAAAVAVVSIDMTIAVVAAVATVADVTTIVEALAMTLMIAASMVADVIVTMDTDLGTLIVTQALAVMTAIVVVATTDAVAAAEAATMIVTMIAADMMLLLVEMMLASLTVVVEITALVRTVMPDKLARLYRKLSTAVFCRPSLSFFTLPWRSLKLHTYFRFHSCIQKACSQCFIGDVSRNSASATTKLFALFPISDSVSFSGYGKDIKLRTILRL